MVKTMRIPNTTTPVLVLSARQHGSLGIIRSLGELGVPVYGTYSGQRGPAMFSRFCKGTFLWDFVGPEYSEQMARELVEIAKIIGRPTILIPTWDETAVFAAEQYQALARWFILPQQSPELASTLVDKSQMYCLAKKHAIPTAEVSVPNSLEDVKHFARTASFPVLLKGIDSNRLQKRAGKRMVIVHTPEELIRLYTYMEERDPRNVMLQEYIPAGKQPDWMFNGYFNESSDCLIGFTGTKIRQTPVYTGMTSLGICTTNSVVAQRTIEWMKQLGYRGILDIGYRYDIRDCEYKVHDVNPRVGATFRLFVGNNGMDVVRALYLDLTGQKVPASTPQEGRKWMVELDFKSSLDYYRDGKLKFLDWLRSLRGINELGYYRKDDLRPIAYLCLMACKKLVGRVRQRAERAAAALARTFSKRNVAGLPANAD
jgi:predicted ATP-grasp superfamily ATP-dependent carboligase